MKNTSFSRPLRIALLGLTGLLALAMLAFCSVLVSQAKSPLSTAAVTTIPFQDGVSPSSAYAGTSDTYISDASPTTPHGAEGIIQITGGITGTRNEWILKKGTRYLFFQIMS